MINYMFFHYPIFYFFCNFYHNYVIELVDDELLELVLELLDEDELVLELLDEDELVDAEVELEDDELEDDELEELVEVDVTKVNVA